MSGQTGYHNLKLRDTAFRRSKINLALGPTFQEPPTNKRESKMKTQMSLATMGALVAALVATIGMPNVSLAQRDAGAKIRGEYNFYGRSAGSAMRSATESSSHYRQYVPTTEKVNPEVAKEASDTIGTYITKAQKHFGWMRKTADAAKDTETLTALDSIDKHLAAAAKSHADMKETCLKDHVDGEATMKCCKVIDDDLAKAIAEHDKLMKKLAAKK